MIGPITCKLCLADVNICKTGIKDHNDRDTGEGNGERHRRRGGGATCFGRRTISFLVKFESSVLMSLMAYIGHLGYFIPNLMNNKADLGFKVLKKLTSKTDKMRKCPKTANFGHVLVYSSNQIFFA